MVIEVNNLCKTYGDRVAVDDISFSVSAGEIFGFLGPNGAGKTTTINVLTGLLKPSSGSAKVAGFDVVSQRTELHRHIGVVFEVQNLYPQMSARANLELFADIYRTPRHVVSELLERMGLAGRSNDLVKNYSQGMKQRLLIARALIAKPEVLFLDEPTVGLDPASARELRSLIRDLQVQGMTVFLTTHYMEEADQLCDRVAIIDTGKLVALDSPDTLKRAHTAPLLDIQFRDGTDATLDLRSVDTPAKLAESIRSGNVGSIHTKETSLEEVFISLTGKRLA